MFAFPGDMTTAIEPKRVSSPDITARVPTRVRNRLFALVMALCALSFVLVGSLPGISYVVLPANSYLVVHTVFEFTSIIVSFAVFIVGWYGYKQNANRQDLVIGILFMTVGLIDFAHTLSYSGMPAFLSPNTVSKACTYWVAARLTDGVGLLAVAFVAATGRRTWLRPSVLVPAGLSLVLALIVTVDYFPEVLPPMFIEGVGLTPLKIHLEWAVIALYAAAIYAFGVRGHREHNVVLLQLALVVAIFSEFSFTLYRSAYDTYNLLGHIYKVAAYYLIFRALFVSSFQRPYYELVKARDQIEESFSRIGAALASSLELKETLQLIADLASDILRTKYALVMMLRDGELYVQAERGMTNCPPKVSTEHTAAGIAVSTKQPVVIEDVTELTGHDRKCHCQNLDGPPARSVVSAPIMSGEDVLGVVEAYSTDVGDFGQREADLLFGFARQAAVAIRNSIAYERERVVAETLQRSLLPAAPSIPGLDIAVRYAPAEEVAKVGGDLYDIFPLDDEHLAIVIGDVCGHGLEAASVTAMTVYMIKGFLLHGMSPGEALEHANLTLCRSATVERETVFVTVFLSVLNTRTHELRYANAGHHMPVLLKNETCELVELRSNLPLAVEALTDYETHVLDLGDAHGVLLYTDGVVEARRHGELFGDDKLCGLCQEMLNRSAEELLERVTDEARGWSGTLHDDIAVLAVKWSS